MGFTRAGLPLGVTFSFLISSPMVDLASLVLLSSIFGAKVAIAYVVAGLVIAVAGGLLIEKLHLEKYIVVEEPKKPCCCCCRKKASTPSPAPAPETISRWLLAYREMVSTFKKVFPYILLGVGIGALIHNWIPKEWAVKILGNKNPGSVILAVLAGVPMYADIFGSIPVAEALLGKGGATGNGPLLYDGGNYVKSPLSYPVAESDPNAPSYYFYIHLYFRDHFNGVSF